jgi:hypothetical protein
MTCCDDKIVLNISDINCSEDKKHHLAKLDKIFVSKDIKILYIITFILIINVMILLFLIQSNYNHNNITIIECLIMIGLALAFSLVRIWNVKFYMLQPILEMNMQNKPQFGSDKILFFFSVFSGFCAVILMIGVIVSIYSSTFTNGIIITCFDIILFILTSLFYRLHVGIYLGKIQ